MNNIVLQKTWVQGRPVVVDNLLGTAFTGEAGAHTFKIRGVDAAQETVTISGTITGKLLAANNVTISLSGSIEDGCAVVTLTDECYDVPGRFIFSVYATSGSTTLCLYCAVGNVLRTDSQVIAYPTESLPNITSLMADLEQILSDWPADYSQLQSDVSSLKSAIVYGGDLVSYNLTSQYSEKQYIKLGVTIGTVIDIDSPTTSTLSNCIVVPCRAGDYFIVTGTSGTNPRLWGVLDSDKKLLSVANQEAQGENVRVDIEQNGYFVSDVYRSYTYSLVHYTLTDSKYSISTVYGHGAVGDGVTDDTEAIQAALDAQSGGVLYIPEGTYLLSDTLHIHSGTHVIGCGLKSVLKLADTYTLDGYTWRSDTGGAYANRYPMIATDADSNGCILENFAVVGQSDTFVDENEDGVCLRGTQHIARNLNISKINYFPDSFSGRSCITPGWGITAIFADTITIENCMIDECGYECIGVEDSDNVLVIGCKTGTGNQTSVQIHRSVNHCRIVNCTMAKTSSCMTMDADPLLPMNDILIDGNYISGALNFVAGGENNIVIVNNRIGASISCNNQEYRSGLMLRGNTITGRVGTYHDNAVITDNIIDISSGYYMIIHNGNKSVIQNNLGIGTVTDIVEHTHD